MTKNFWEHWEWKLWLGDPNLGMCHPATRGIWMDALCAMMERSSDRLTGTPEQLAQICRCQVSYFLTAIDDLEKQDAAEISKQNGIITLVSRKRRRDLEISHKRSIAGFIGGSKPKANRKQEGKQHSYFNYKCGGERKYETIGGNGALVEVYKDQPPFTREEFEVAGKELNVLLSDLNECWNFYGSQGWRKSNGRGLGTDARLVLASWMDMKAKRAREENARNNVKAKKHAI